MEVGKMEMSTKDRILEAALDLFSKKGFNGTSMSDIAAALGMTKAALYRHYEGKDEILGSLVEQGEVLYKTHMGEKHLGCPSSAEELYSSSMEWIRFIMDTPELRKFRRMITIEQFKDETLAAIATQHLNLDFPKIYVGMFKQMIDQGILKDDDPEILSLEFSCPILVGISLCDRQPEMHDEILNKIEAHLKHFIQTYSVNKNPEGNTI